MNSLVVPAALKQGDTIALISISGGRAGDADMIPRYEIGKKRLEDIFGLKVITTPNALRGSQYLYEHPEERAADLIWALKNPDVKGIICMMGGDDSYRVFPYIDPDLIAKYPKVFMGYSDICSWMAVYAYAGVRAYYGPNLLTPIAQPAQLDNYTRQAIKKCLFCTDIIGEITPCKAYTPINWNNVTEEEIVWTSNPGYRVIQGSKTVTGRLFGGSIGPLRQIMGTKYFPRAEFFEDCIVMIESGSPYGSSLAGLHELRALDAAGVFKKAAGVLINPLNSEEEQILLRFLKYEARREDLVVLANVDFVHRTPMTVLPMGAMAEIDCENSAFRILEPGVNA